MNILVTGGAGFIGSHVCDALITQGNNCFVYDNFNDYYSPLYKRENIKSIKNISVIEADIRDTNAMRECFAKNAFDAVIHLAAYAGVRPSIENPLLYADVNINGTLQLLEAMREHGVKNLLFASSSSVYGNNKKVPFAESDMVDTPISPYAATKKAGELLCHTYHHLYDINVACLRFFTVYGPRQRPDLAIYKFANAIYADKEIPFFGDGTMGRDYTYIEDITNGVLAALDWVKSNEKRYDIFNLGEAYTVSLSDMVKTLESVIGKSAKIKRLPVPPGDVNITSADINKSKKILNYNPKTTFDEGIKKFVAWFKESRLEV